MMIYWRKCSRLCSCASVNWGHSGDLPLHLGRYWGWQMNASFSTTFGLRRKKAFLQTFPLMEHFGFGKFVWSYYENTIPSQSLQMRTTRLVTWGLLMNSNTVSATWFWQFALTAISREVMKNSDWQLVYYTCYRLGKEAGGEHNEQEQYYLGFFKRTSFIMSNQNILSQHKLWQ